MNPDLESTMLRAMAAAEGRRSVPTLAEREADADAAARDRVEAEAALRKECSAHAALAERLRVAQETQDARERAASEADAEASELIAAGASDADADKALRHVETLRRNAQIPARVIEALTPQLEAASAAIDAAREAATTANARHWQSRAALLETRVWIEAAPLLADLLEARTIAFRSPTLPGSAVLARHAATALREAGEAAAA